MAQLLLVTSSAEITDVTKFNNIIAEITEATNTWPSGLNIVLIIGFTIAAVLICLLAVLVAALCIQRYTGKDRKQNSWQATSTVIQYIMIIPWVYLMEMHIASYIACTAMLHGYWCTACLNNFRRYYKPEIYQYMRVWERMSQFPTLGILL